MEISKSKINKFFAVYNKYYDLMYDGKCPETLWELGEHFIKEDRETVTALTQACEDCFVSDRELSAYAVAYAATFIN